MLFKKKVQATRKKVRIDAREDRKRLPYDPNKLVQRNEGLAIIEIKDQELCLKECDHKSCTYFCPSQVFSWIREETRVLPERCVECGACVLGCPYNNINWDYPPGGGGIKYRY